MYQPNPAQDDLLRQRYLMPGETPDGMFRRVADAVAVEFSPEERAHWSNVYFDMMSGGRFLPNTPTLVHAGRDNGKCLSACFVDSPDDNLADIVRILSEIPQIESAGGGIGWGLSRLRPAGDQVGEWVGACGPINVLRLYALAGGTFTQGAVRPGAHMAQLRCDHPDIMDFIDSKPHDAHGLHNVNISVQITDDFVACLERDGHFPLVNPRTGDIVSKPRASDIWGAISNAAWACGDPGVAFIDRVNRAHPNPHAGPIRSSNPCGEEWLEDGNSCNLGSINLAAHLLQRGDNTDIDWQKLEQTIIAAVRFLDGVIDINHFPFLRQHEMAHAFRRIGLGVMGWADALAYMGIPYDSLDALNLADSLGGFIRGRAHSASFALGQERGPAERCARRNSSVTTIAPTGSISIIAGCSSGIEPHYALFTERHWTNGSMLEMPAPLAAALEVNGDDAREAVWRTMVDLPRDEQRAYVKAHAGAAFADTLRTAHDIAPEWHIRMAAAWQRTTDNGVSKTVNLPHDAKPADIGRLYLMAYELGLKAVSVYRDGSLDHQILCAGGV